MYHSASLSEKITVGDEVVCIENLSARSSRGYGWKWGKIFRINKIEEYDNGFRIFHILFPRNGEGVYSDFVRLVRESTLKVGSKVRVREDSEWSRQREYGIGTIIRDDETTGLSLVVDFPNGMRLAYGKKDLELVESENKIKQEVSKMLNETIKKMYPKTEDADLVQEMMGSSFGRDKVMDTIVQKFGKEILDEAKRLKKENDDAKK